MINLFRSYDLENSGQIEETDFNNILRNLGYLNVSDAEIINIVSRCERHEVHKISWNEFVEILIKFRKMDLTEIEAYANEQKAKGTKSESVFLYPIEEKIAFANALNIIFKDDQDMENLIPINSKDQSLFKALENGILLGVLLNKISGDAVDM